MRKMITEKKLIFPIIIALLIVIFLTNINVVNAADNTGIDDGIDNWTQADKTKTGSIKINDKYNLGYTFGLARDSTGLFRDGGDETITDESSLSNSNNYVTKSKINIFLTDNIRFPHYINTSFQMGSGDKLKEYVSLTSPDFLIVPDENTSNVTNKPYSLLANKLYNKKYYTGTDSNGNQVSKITGDFIRNDEGGDYDLQAEILLRASPSNASIVQVELYLQNNQDYDQSLGVLYGEDTSLDDNKITGGDADGDYVGLKSLGNGNGFFFTKNDISMILSRTVEDGPSNYSYIDYNGLKSVDWAQKFNPANFLGTGLESDKTNYGDVYFNPNTNIDTGYTLKWPYKTIKSGQTAHYAFALGVTESNYALPTPSVTYTNTDSSDDKNRVGDKLHFKLQMANNGYSSTFALNKIFNQIPAGLTLDTSSLKLTYPNGTTQAVNADNYNSTTGLLSVSTPISVANGQSATLSFDATINASASNSTITNTGQFTGKLSANASDKTYQDSVNIPVEKAEYKDSFVQETKLSSDPDSAYSTNDLDVKTGDSVDFKYVYKVEPDSAFGFAGNLDSYFKSTLPTGLDLKNNSIKVQYNLDGIQIVKSLDFNISKTMEPGDYLTVTFTATVNNSATAIITNNATVYGKVNSTDSDKIETVSNSTNLNVKNLVGFEEVPSKIDFGSTNAGANKTLYNINTIGQLKVNHNNDTPYMVTVSYDNDSDNKIQTTSGDPFNNSSDVFLYLKQPTNMNETDGNWEPITADGTRLQTEALQGSQDLTSLIGVKNWKMLMTSSTKSGTYTGKVTWTIVDGPQ